MNLAIVKYNAGNVRSVLHALERLGIAAAVTDNPDELAAADKVIFPGVGEASSAMKYLKQKKLDTVIRNLRQPVLGICLGMQLMCRHSEENDADCLGIFDLEVRRFPDNSGKIPQVGWNDVFDLKGSLFSGLRLHEFVYFVHSYYVEFSTETIATAHYGLDYSAGLHSGNFYALQFHPEKSAEAGQRMLENFLKL